MNKKETKNKVLKCKTCNSLLDFYLHECKRAIQEYYGCRKCDDWCTSCKPDWNKNK